VLVIVADFIFSWGDDTYTHVFRIAVLTDGLRASDMGMLLVDPGTDGPAAS